MKPQLIIIMGPTAAGKTEFARKLSHFLTCDIINCDVGQFYTPLTIGTAKPDWRKESSTHHLFDILDNPINYNVVEYRNAALKIVKNLSHSLGIIVGGSSFYVQSIFFPPYNNEKKSIESIEPDTYHSLTSDILWKRLQLLDQTRAHAIHHNDRYRIIRALRMYELEGVLPSTVKPKGDIPCKTLLIWCTRERNDLYDRITQRVPLMINEGWIEEVRALSQDWQEFLQKKRLLGYPEIIDFLQKKHMSLEQLITIIAQKTRNYAKRQISYWRMFRQLLESISYNTEEKLLEIREVNLTFTDIDLYIKQLSDELIKG
jgi:tRNA dimethylallyltransferase